MQKRLVVIGDIHGCLEEFDELLNLISYSKENTNLILVGDFLERGPDSIGVIRKIQENNILSVLGNHEDKFIRYHNHQDIFLKTGKKNPMKPLSTLSTEVFNKLTDDDWTWLSNLPLKLNPISNLYVMHAGASPNHPIDSQSKTFLTKIRFIDSDGNMKSLNPDFSQPENTIYWTEKWNGFESIIYGHAVHKDFQVRFDDRKNGVFCLGIDTGCVFDGSLTAAIINSPSTFTNIEFVQVKALKEYVNLKDFSCS
jgi:hypothetical protein